MLRRAAPRLSCMLLVLACVVGCDPAFETFNDPGGKYSVKMPGKPKPASSSVGLGIPGASAWEVRTGRYLAVCARIDLGAAAAQSNPFAGMFGGTVQINPETLYSAMEQGLRAESRLESVKLSTVTIGGHAGRQFAYNIKAGTTDPTTGEKLRGTSNILNVVIIGNDMFLFEYGAPGITAASSAPKTMMDSITFSVGGSAGAPVPPPGMNTTTAPTMPGVTINGNGGHNATNPTQMPGMQPNGHNATNPMANPNATASLPPGVTINGAGGTNPTQTPMMPPVNPMAGHQPAGATDPNATASLPPGVTINGGGGTNPMQTPMGGHGAANPMATMPPGTFPGAFPGMNAMGANNAQKPAYTGTPIDAETEVKRGDKLQAWANGRWVNVVVERIFPTGTVFVRTYGVPPYITAELDRSFLQRSLSEPVTETPRKTAPVRPAGNSNPPVELEGLSAEELLNVAAGKSDTSKRTKALELLREFPGASPTDEISSGLVKLLDSKERTIRGGAAQALELWATDEALPVLEGLLKESQSDIRQAAIKTLGARQATSAIPTIAGQLKQTADRKVVAEALKAYGAAAEPAVLELMGERDDKARLVLCEILTEIGTKQSVPALQKAQKDWSGLAKVAARKAVAAIEAREK